MPAVSVTKTSKKSSLDPICRSYIIPAAHRSRLYQTQARPVKVDKDMVSKLAMGSTIPNDAKHCGDAIRVIG